jgi:hypothetical protein
MDMQKVCLPQCEPLVQKDADDYLPFFRNLLDQGFNFPHPFEDRVIGILQQPVE